MPGDPTLDPEAHIYVFKPFELSAPGEGSLKSCLPCWRNRTLIKSEGKKPPILFFLGGSDMTDDRFNFTGQDHR